MKKMEDLCKVILGCFFKILFIVGFLLMFGVVGGIEQNTLTYLQAIAFMILSVVMMLVSYYWLEIKDNECQKNEVEKTGERYSA